jgi:GT2 family glycosyltransferase
MSNNRFTPGLVSIILVALDYQMHFLKALYDSLASQTYTAIEIVLVDKTTGIAATEYAAQYPHLTTLSIASGKPAGFAENNNIGIRQASGEFTFVLNVDAVLTPECIERLVTATNLDFSIGAVSPKILRMTSEGVRHNPPVYDSAGMTLRANVRHHDRGAGEIDSGQYDQTEFVFGVSGAAAFFKRECLEHLRIGSQYFDEDFWSYREDADLSWRLQNYGWKCLYMPAAVVYHARTLKPGPRSANSRLANMHSVKNRFLLMLNNMAWQTYLQNLLHIIARDIVVIAAVSLREQHSLPGLWFVAKNYRRLLQKRRRIMAHAALDAAPYWFKNDTQILVLMEPVQEGIHASH